MDADGIINNKEELPLKFYLEKYEKSDPMLMAGETDLKFDGKCFRIHLLKDCFTVSFPDFVIRGDRELSNKERILFLRYLTEGHFVPASGRFLTYRELPWGEVYIRQFTGRCIQRFAFSYGSRPQVLREVMKRMHAKVSKGGNAAYELEFMDGFDIRFILWLGDEEFAPSVQILFSDNFPAAFSAEDAAVTGDIIIDRMKQIESEIAKENGVK